MVVKRFTKPFDKASNPGSASSLLSATWTGDRECAAARWPGPPTPAGTVRDHRRWSHRARELIGRLVAIALTAGLPIPNTLMRTTPLGSALLLGPISALFAASIAAQASWTQLYPSQTPPVRYNALWVSHEGNGALSMLYGTDLATGQISTQAWLFQNGAWSLQAAPLPPPRSFAAVAYDANVQQAIFFGGDASGVDLDDTWLWNGATWSQANPATRPPSRGRATMAYDHRRRVVVLLGGYRNGTGTILGDTWEWDGSVWQLRTLPTSPPARLDASSAYDPVTGSVLLFGGSYSAGPTVQPLGDTWSFDGNQWVQMQPATPPSPRFWAGMVTDLRRQRVVLLGGHTVDPFAWEWDGLQWTPRYQPCPMPRELFGVA